MKKVVQRTVFILLCVLIGFFNSPQVQALDVQFYSGNDILWSNPDAVCRTGSSDTGTPSGSVGGLEDFLRALAKQESGGNPTAANPGSSARGKYQYITDTWQSRWALYPPANKYATADLAPEAVQDALVYIEYAQKWNEFDGSIFKLAISHFYPAANSDPALLDQHVGPSSNPTPRQYADAVVEKVTNGYGSEIPLLFADAPDFQEHLEAATGGKTDFSTSPSLPTPTASGCADKSSDGGVVEEGGLTEAQAKKFMMNYGANRDGDSAEQTGANWDNCNGGGSNCVTFSQFFFNKFSTEDYRGTMGDGKDVVGNMMADGIPTGNQIRLFSIFSMGGGGGYGHTGVVLGIHGDTIIVGHASCGNPGIGEGDGTLEGGGSGFIKVGKITESTAWYAGSIPTQFAYPRGLDTSKIQEYINS